MQKTKNKNRFSAFTLVELIVVIVILSILATIAFMSFWSQSSSARDSQRLSDLSTVWKWLTVKSTTQWYYNMPDKYINILKWTWVIWYQWEVWDGIKRVLTTDLNNFKDPLDKTNYSYTINAAKNRYELLAFLENKWNISLEYKLNINEVKAVSYVSRYPYTKWDNLWLIVISTWSSTSPTYIPIQYMWTWTAWIGTWGVDISSWSLISAWWVALISNDQTLQWQISITVATNNYTTTWSTTTTYVPYSNNIITNMSWLVSYWPLDWGLKDLAWANDLVNYSGVFTWWSIWQWVYFDGTNYMLSQNNVWISWTASRSLSFWMKNPNKAWAWTAMLWWWWTCYNYFYPHSKSYYWPNYMLWLCWSDWHTTANVNSYSWWEHHVVIFDWTNLKWYVNWSKASESVYWINTVDSKFSIWWATWAWFVWYIDDVSVWNRVLTDTEITSIYSWWISWKWIKY